MSPVGEALTGPGWFGLAVAKTYLQVDPTIALTVLEADASLGGTWSRTRGHPDLTTQQPFGAYEFPDRPLAPPADGAKFIPAPTLHEYMVAYATEHGVATKIRYNSPVTRIARAGAQWEVTVAGRAGADANAGDGVESGSGAEIGAEIGAGAGTGAEWRGRFDKLIMATGLTSTPVLPAIPGLASESIAAAPRVFHARDVGTHYEWLTGSHVTRVVVCGGGKSAADTTYLCAKHGKHVDWVVRPDAEGGGSAGLLPTRLLGKDGKDAIASRFAASQQPSLDALDSRAWRWLHSGRNALGYALHWAWWGVLCRAMQRYPGYDLSENMGRLRPAVTDRFGFWAPVPASLATQPDLLDMIHAGDRIAVHRASIAAIVPSPASPAAPATAATTAAAVTTAAGVLLADTASTRLSADAVVLCTGYYGFSRIIAPAELGLPMPVDAYPTELAAHWAALEATADADVLRLFPRLRQAPAVTPRTLSHTPYRLVRRIVPVDFVLRGDRSFAVVGAVGAAGTAMYVLAPLSSPWHVMAWLLRCGPPTDRECA